MQISNLFFNMKKFKMGYVFENLIEFLFIERTINELAGGYNTNSDIRLTNFS